MQLTLAQIAEMLNGTLEGDPSVKVRNVGKIESAKPGELAFLSNPRYEAHLYSSQAEAVIVNEDFRPSQEVKPSLIRVKNAYLAFTQLLKEYEKLILPPKTGWEEPAHLGKGTQKWENGYMGAFAYVGENCKIGKGVQIHPHAWIGDNCTIEDNTIVYSGAKVYARTEIGKNCTIHANAVVGSDGFGFAPKEDGSYDPIPQIGKVVLKDWVSIGSNTTIDRATMGETILHEGVKIDNLVQIAHNVEIGKHTVMAGQSGISGSSKLGDFCRVAGQVGIVGHIEIANHTTLGAKAGVSKGVKKEGLTLLGQPAREQLEEGKSMAVYRRLPDLKKQIDQIKRTLEQQQEAQ